MTVNEFLNLGYHFVSWEDAQLNGFTFFTTAIGGQPVIPQVESVMRLRFGTSELVPGTVADIQSLAVAVCHLNRLMWDKWIKIINTDYNLLNEFKTNESRDSHDNHVIDTTRNETKDNTGTQTNAGSKNNTRTDNLTEQLTNTNTRTDNLREETANTNTRTDNLQEATTNSSTRTDNLQEATTNSSTSTALKNAYNSATFKNNEKTEDSGSGSRTNTGTQQDSGSGSRTNTGTQQDSGSGSRTNTGTQQDSGSGSRINTGTQTNAQTDSTTRTDNLKEVKEGRELKEDTATGQETVNKSGYNHAPAEIFEREIAFYSKSLVDSIANAIASYTTFFNFYGV